MTIEQLGSIGEFVAAIATIITLIYLAIQIRASSKVAKGSSYHAAVEQTWQSILTLVNNAEIRDILYRATLSEQLSEKDVYQLYLLNVAVVYGFENIFKLWEEGLVDEEVWQNLNQNELTEWFRVPQNWEFLNQRKGALAGRFRDSVRKELDKK